MIRFELADRNQFATGIEWEIAARRQVGEVHCEE